MILKLRTGIDKNLSWRLIDYVDRIDYKYIDEPKKFGTDEDYINVFGDLENKRIVKILVWYRNGNRREIYTDDAVYVLNNEGKTCDTINI